LLAQSFDHRAADFSSNSPLAFNFSRNPFRDALQIEHEQGQSTPEDFVAALLGHMKRAAEKQARIKVKAAIILVSERGRT
jgi:hypothetical protein